MIICLVERNGIKEGYNKVANLWVTFYFLKKMTRMKYDDNYFFLKIIYFYLNVNIY